MVVWEGDILVEQRFDQDSADYHTQSPDVLPVLKQPGLDDLAKSLTLKDGILATAALLVLWYAAGLCLGKARPYVTKTTLTYLSGFTIQAVLAAIIMLLSWLKGFRLRDLGYRRVSFSEGAKSVLRAYALVLMFIVSYFTVIAVYGLNPPADNTYTFLFSQKGWLIILNFLLAVVLAPVFEETMFRGVVYASLRAKLTTWPAALLSGAIFAGLHFDVYGFLPRFFLGVLLARLFERYKSLYPSMGLHALHNGVLFLLSLALLSLKSVSH